MRTYEPLPDPTYHPVAYELAAALNDPAVPRVTIEIRTIRHGAVEHRSWLELHLIDAAHFATLLNEVISQAVPPRTAVFKPSNIGGHW